MATALVHLTSDVPRFNPVGGWAQRWGAGLPMSGVGTDKPPLAPPATGRALSHSQLLVAPGGCGTFTYRLCVLAQCSPSMKSVSAGWLAERCIVGGMGAAAGSSSCPWPAFARWPWGSCQRLPVGVWGSHNSYITGVHWQKQQPLACPCQPDERSAGNVGDVAALQCLHGTCRSDAIPGIQSGC